jgi:hypothetical protein
MNEASRLGLGSDVGGKEVGHDMRHYAKVGDMSTRWLQAKLASSVQLSCGVVAREVFQDMERVDLDALDLVLSLLLDLSN